MENKSISSNTAENETHAPLEYPPSIEPLFWGTGEMLVWDMAQLVTAIDRESLFALVTGGEGVPTIHKEEFLREMAIVAGRITDINLGGPRGFYSFFPVVTEGTSVIVLDPSDFHTELLNLSFPAEEKINGRPVAEFFRPDGDLISFSTFTTGCHLLMEAVDEASDGAVSTKVIRSAFERRLVELLETKITMEIRRAIGIEADAGRSFRFRPDNEKFPEIFDRLFELLNIEDRLGIATTTAITHETYPAAVRYFIHHPAAE